uniref:Sushi domain-containing protein n=1 Tax=Crocodylus porosus TaxID=8502 RepID=A0A7M4DV35_CROPO
MSHFQLLILCVAFCLEVTCDHPKVADGSFVPSKTIYREEDVIIVDCKHGFHFDSFSGNTAQCTKNGWIPVPKCVYICKKIEITHGYFTEKKDIFNLNEETTYRCVIGYTTPDGKETGDIRCSHTGWSPSPGCSKTCTRPNLENILLKTSKKVFSPGDDLTYECADGYQTIHKSTSTYTMCGKNGWTPEPQCLAIECEMLTLAKGAISPQEGKYRNGDVITFSCAKSYTRVGPDSTQCYYFGWSPAPPLCKEEVRSCEQPQAVVNATIISEVQELYEHGTIMEYQCNSRFKMIGSSKIECIDGKWSPPPSCIEEVKTCGPPPVIRNGAALHTDRTEYFHGDSVAYGCEKNFEIWGAGEAKCLSGEWTRLPLCADKSAQCAVTRSSAEISIIQYRPNSAEKANFGTVVKYKCKTEVKNSKESTCVSGKWLPEIECKPKEIKKQCPPPPQVPGALNVIEVRNYESGEEITFQCLENFEASPGMDKILCQDGKWQSPPRCVEKNACGLPRPLENGKLRQEHQNPGTEQSGPVTYPNGTVLEYACHTGFVLKGQSKITCSMGTWTEGPACDEMPCGKVPSVLHSVPRRAAKSHYVPGETVRYECKRGFSIRGEQNIICQAGNWTKPPTCEGMCIVGHNIFPETKVLFGCFSLLTHSCMSRLPDVTCGPPPQVANADVVSSRPQKSAPGTKVQYRCHPNFQIVGSNEVTCENKRWSQAPTCQSKSLCF